MLDKLQVERERGITVKAQTVTLLHTHQHVPYVLNLIDTPGAVYAPAVLPLLLPASCAPCGLTVGCGVQGTWTSATR